MYRGTDHLQKKIQYNQIIKPRELYCLITLFLLDDGTCRKTPLISHLLTELEKFQRRGNSSLNGFLLITYSRIILGMMWIIIQIKEDDHPRWISKSLRNQHNSSHHTIVEFNNCFSKFFQVLNKRTSS